MSLRLPILFVVTCSLAAGVGRAQTSTRAHPGSSPGDTTTQRASSAPERAPFRPSSTALSLWVGGSLTTGDLIGKISRSRLGLVGLRYNRRLAPEEGDDRSHETSLVFTADLYPLVYLSIPPNTVPAPPESGEPTNGSRQQAADESAYEQGMSSYGVGASPVGLRLNFGPSQRIVPFVAGSAGMVYFSEAIPDARGKHLNFTVDFGAGLQVIPSSGVSLTVGYRYHHLSNGFRGQINPGVDANLFYLEVSFWR